MGRVQSNRPHFRARALRARLCAAGIGMLCAALASFAAPAAEPGDVWPTWQAFKKAFISADGRVIDPSDKDLHTVSEGQAYALFFALVDGDKAQFDALLRWTENNLAQGDLAHQLPAWRWGRTPEGSWAVLDSNPASDADLWMAYTLLNAGRHWCDRRYAALGRRLATQIVLKETATVPGLGKTLLPAPQGFDLGDGRYRLNPSYVPLNVVRALATDVYSGADAQATATGWIGVYQSSKVLLLQSAPKGFSPEWTVWNKTRFEPDEDTQGEASYNAIRTYLWIGLSAYAPAGIDTDRAELVQRYQGMLDWTRNHGLPPERIHSITLQSNGNEGPIGFVASVASMAKAAGDDALHKRLWARVQAELAQRPVTDIGYYNSALVLFAQAFEDGRVRFGSQGQLVMKHAPACKAEAP